LVLAFDVAMTIPGTYTNVPTSLEFKVLNGRGISFDVSFTCTLARPGARSLDARSSSSKYASPSAAANASLGRKLSNTSCTASSNIGK
jgi:hypothetical protein